jgi:hypothetical protein
VLAVRTGRDFQLRNLAVVGSTGFVCTHRDRDISGIRNRDISGRDISGGDIRGNRNIGGRGATSGSELLRSRQRTFGSSNRDKRSNRDRATSSSE